MNSGNLKPVIDFFGSQVAVARKINATPQMINHWIRRESVPAKWAVKIEQVTNGAITRAEIRPDIFG